MLADKSYSSCRLRTYTRRRGVGHTTSKGPSAAKATVPRFDRETYRRGITRRTLFQDEKPLVRSKDGVLCGEADETLVAAQGGGETEKGQVVPGVS
ncbi:hypothetical protein, partial [Streptomyces sioyaensis]|uniref:hypothetical protein n=1 Tax=Streptomyces sioyaensis TaxID=67364 RepID=UPI0036EC61D9